MNYYIIPALFYIFFGSLFLITWRLRYHYQYVIHNRFGEGDPEVLSRPDTSLTFVLQDVFSFSLIGTGFLFEGISTEYSHPMNIYATIIVTVIELILVFFIGFDASVDLPDYVPEMSPVAGPGLLLLVLMLVAFTDSPSPLFSWVETAIFSFPFIVYVAYLVFTVRLARTLKK